MRSNVLLRGLCAAAVLTGAGSAGAQVLQPSSPTQRRVVPVGLDCTAEAANVSGFVGSDGTVAIYNVPAGQGQVRLRATCTDALGNTVLGQSAPVTPVPGGVVRVGTIDFDNTVPIAARLTMTPPSGHLVGLGSSLQLAVGAAFADQTTGNVTAGSTGTSYRSSNPAVATVSVNGLVTAVGPGSTLIYAVNEGAGGLATVSVLPAALASLSAVPANLSFAISPTFPAQPVQLSITGTLSDSGTVDWTAPSCGVTYQSSDPSVAVVSVGGAVLGLSPGSAVITALDSASGISTQIPVTVAASAPVPFNACSTQDYAYDVDVAGVWAFVATGYSGLQIINSNDCTTGGTLSFDNAYAVDVKVRGGLAAVALEYSGFALVDVSTIATPTLRSLTSSIGSVRDLWISGDVLYVASSDGLFVYDISDPTAPSLLGSRSFSAPVQAVSADSTRGIIVAVTAAPSVEVIQWVGGALSPTASIALPSAGNQADDVALLGTSAYVANGTSGLVEIDITNLNAPTIKSTTTLTFDALGVAVQKTPQGTFVAAADDQFVNAVPLFNARLVNTFNIDFSDFPSVIQSDANSNGIALGDGFGVVSTGYSGIQVFRSRPLVDNAGIAPTVSVLTPSDGVNVPSGYDFPITAVALDDVQVAFVDLIVDGVYVETDTTAPFAFSYLAGNVGVTHTVQLQATDLAGNVGASHPVHVNSIQSPCTGVVCTALDPCHDVGTCDLATGICSDPPKSYGALCDDGDPVTDYSVCVGGVCTGSTGVHPLFANGPGFTCPTSATVFAYVGALDPTSSDQAKAACETCYGTPCFLESADCAGLGWGPNPAGQYQCGQAYFGFQNGCSGDDGRSWGICNSYTTYGYWAKF